MHNILNYTSASYTCTCTCTCITLCNTGFLTTVFYDGSLACLGVCGLCGRGGGEVRARRGYTWTSVVLHVHTPT